MRLNSSNYNVTCVSIYIYITSLNNTLYKILEDFYILKSTYKTVVQ